MASAAALIAGASALWVALAPRGGEAPDEPSDLQRQSSNKDVEPAPRESFVLPLTVLTDAPFAQEFGLESTSPERELELVQLAFEAYLSFVKERYRKPFGYNAELVALLQGDNPLRIAPIAPGHSRVDGEGRLTDRWGTPLGIHPLSSTAIEIRSAGPDELMYTEDDLRQVSSSGQDILDAMRPVAGGGTKPQDAAGAVRLWEVGQ